MPERGNCGSVGSTAASAAGAAPVAAAAAAAAVATAISIGEGSICTGVPEANVAAEWFNFPLRESNGGGGCGGCVECGGEEASVTSCMSMGGMVAKVVTAIAPAVGAGKFTSVSTAVVAAVDAEMSTATAVGAVAGVSGR